MGNNFYKPKHYDIPLSVPETSYNSRFSKEAAFSASAQISAHGTAFLQANDTIIYGGNVVGYSAKIIPPGSMTATGWSSFAAITENNPHIFFYPPERANYFICNGIWTPTAWNR